MKKIVFLSLVCLLAVFAVIKSGQTQTKSYYSGDAISFNDAVYVASTNTDSLEVFKLENSSLQLLASVRPFDGVFNRYGSFYDAKLSSESGRLFVYTISGYTVYKYEVVNDNSLNLVASQKNNYWEWYSRVDKFGDHIVTISARGVKILNSSLDVIDSFKLDTKTPYNLRANGNRFIANVQDDQLIIFDRERRENVKTISLNYINNPGNRQTYQDGNGNIYAVDDYYARKFNLLGADLGSFRHADYSGYDITASGETDYVYFSDGIGVVKLDKNTMKEIESTNTTSIGGARGWAMGLKVVTTGGSDKIVVFNNSNILVLNDKLQKLASAAMTEEAEISSTENLFLNLNRGFGASGAVITLNGGGYLPNEKLSVNFAGTTTTVQADARGRFKQDLTVPALAVGVVAPKGVDIKVDGQNSKLSYSISFNIQ
jgi:hypothetical protein